MSQTEETKDLIKIEKWVKKRAGVPAIVKDTKDLLRIKFDSLDSSLDEITWAKFFKIFKDNKLIFIYESDEASRFCKFINGEEV